MKKFIGMSAFASLLLSAASPTLAADASAFGGLNLSFGASASSSAYEGHRYGNGSWSGKVLGYTDTGDYDNRIDVNGDYAYSERFTLPVDTPKAGFNASIGYNHAMDGSPLVLGFFGKYNNGLFSKGTVSNSYDEDFNSSAGDSWSVGGNGGGGGGGGGGSDRTPGQSYSFAPSINPSSGVAASYEPTLKHAYDIGTKLGLAVTDHTMIFASVGYGLGNAKTFAGDQLVHGLTYGGGVETNLTESVFIGVQAQFMSLKGTDRDDNTTFDEGFTESAWERASPQLIDYSLTSNHKFKSDFDIYTVGISLGIRF